MLLNDLIGCTNRPPIVIAYGGGTDSTAMILACHERGVPFDAIIFADTGGEKPNTYEFLDIMDTWLIAHGYGKIERVKKKTETLEQYCLRTNKLPSIAFGKKDCSYQWKVIPQKQFIKRWDPAKKAWAAGDKVIQFIGYDATETRRATRTEDDQFIYVYPLMQWHMTRSDCLLLIEKHGLPLPGKSSCFFCPMNKRKDIYALADEHPELIERALTIERQAVLRPSSTIGLGRGYRWVDLLDEHERTKKLATLFDEAMPCGCYDGD